MTRSRSAGRLLVLALAFTASTECSAFQLRVRGHQNILRKQPANLERKRGQATALFSGIVEHMGTIDQVYTDKQMKLWDGRLSEGMELTVSSASTFLDRVYEGCSIAINGVCLTVIKYTDATFTVDCAPETIRRTNLGPLHRGDLVNLERSLPIDGRNSGHIVQGHVDDTGEIIDRWNDGESLWLKIRVSRELLPYVVSKGYIAIDGASLTVCDVNRAESWFTFMLIPFTQQHVIIPRKSLGDKVNLEVDVLAKYVASSAGTLIQQMQQELGALQERVAQLEGCAPAGS